MERMTSSQDIRHWMSKNGHTYDTAAVALDISRRTFARLLTSHEVPLTIGLAISALDAGLSAYKTPI